MGNVCIGNINPGALSLGFVTSLMETMGQNDPLDKNGFKLIEQVIMRRSGPYLDQGRNYVCQSFLETECDWLLFIDSDISWTRENIEKLVASAHPKYKPVVSGVYYSNFGATDTSKGGVLPVVYRWGYKEDPVGGPTYTFVNDNWKDGEWPDDRLFKVDSFGAGFLLIHRSILEEMIGRYGFPAPWFLCQVVKDVMMGEDHLFCLRVAHMGHSLYVHTGVQVGHHKGTDLSGGTK